MYLRNNKIISKYNKIFTIFLLFISILLYHPKIWATWLTSNSAIIKYDSSRWDSYHTINPFVIFDTGIYKIWYTGNGGPGWRIGYGTSNNGTNWTIQTPSILNPSGAIEQHLTQAFIRHEDIIYKAWYSAITTTSAKLGYATSSDGVTWTKNAEPIFSGIPGKWDERVTDRGLSIIKIGNEYKMWYAASTMGIAWRIGYATSPDGITWTRHPNNPVITKTEPTWEFDNMMYPFVLYENGIFKMWYGTGIGDSCTQYAYAESTNGYEWTKPADKNPVYKASGVPGAFDKSALAGLSIIRENDTYKIWYSGFDGTHWSIGYATSSADPLPPTPTPIEPVVIIPGTMASWNKEGILEGQTNPTTPWKLLPFVKEYDGLVQTLKNIGYEEGKNLFLWPYDWRSTIDTTTLRFNQFIESTVKPKNPGSKIQLVGHSLGGLISRNWVQTNTNKEQVHHIVTVAAPNKGVIQPYKAWSGGDVTQDNSFLSLATRIIIELNRRAYPTTRQVVQQIFPVLKDLLPTESYLKRSSNNTYINESDMTIRNTWLRTLNTAPSPIYPVLDTLYGTGFQTPHAYTVTPPTWIDTVLGNWKDGKPISQEMADGDMIVTTNRATLDDPSIPLSQHHNDMVSQPSGIRHILQTLEIPASDSAIVAGQTTTIQPGILFLLRSPAKLSVVYKTKTYTDFDGIIFIPGATNATYQATVTGTGTGTYRLAVGEFSDSQTTWKEYVGTTTPNKKDTYTISFSPSTPKQDPAVNLSDLQRLEEIDVQLANLSTLSTHGAIAKARSDVKIGISALSRKDYNTVKNQLETVLLDMSSLRKSNPTESVRLTSFTVSDTLVDAYQAIVSKKTSLIDPSSLSKILTLCTNEETRLNIILENKSKLGENVLLKTQTYMEGKSYKERAQQTTNTEIPKKYILFFQSQILFREVGL